MKYILSIIFSTTTFYGLITTAHAEPQFVLEARQVTTQYQDELKTALLSAIESGGPKKGVEVCKERAINIAQEVSEESGWQVSRVSLKARNTKNQPSEHEREILEQFEMSVADGKSTQAMEWWQSKSEQQIYMKAITTGGLCLTCHGENVDPELKEVILNNYPRDTATGFKLGDIRGAFVLKRSTN